MEHSARRKRLRDVAVGLTADRHQQSFGRVVGRDHHHARWSREVLHLGQHVEAAHVGQPYVEQHHVERLVPERIERLASVADLHDAVAGLLQERAYRVPKPAIVVDDQNAAGSDRARCHGELPAETDV